jgi:hypothetical protein
MGAVWEGGKWKRVAGRWRMHIFFIDFLLRNHGDCRFLIPTGRESKPVPAILWHIS